MQWIEGRTLQFLLLNTHPVFLSFFMIVFISRPVNLCFSCLDNRLPCQGAHGSNGRRRVRTSWKSQTRAMKLRNWLARSIGFFILIFRTHSGLFVLVSAVMVGPHSDFVARDLWIIPILSCNNFLHSPARTASPLERYHCSFYKCLCSCERQCREQR